jgi:hypothetical protein
VLRCRNIPEGRGSVATGEPNGCPSRPTREMFYCSYLADMLELTDMDIGKADPTQEESRIITGNDFLLMILLNCFLCLFN